ncbi:MULTISPECIES: helix-turn-helix transcriptional regulator [unclassified Treponema]|uniref:helix-turn-helix domain-containing protein n=1 Tax=unclassified Treponema TaxID=2638727 RepID=UPI0020A27C7C|nr:MULTISPECIES: helix-turn-helix transcriptional regulator [unclassified Treponema]UTC67225.1 XRE family transcriptional regulator [Treponema sp. OMZ 789]UTC69954.1 XRE family transcriptional regulator [Treponema sp. OMZ 790]UTC72669.1 XRE family transcriptional regulator [Treponema sp. OMZ 791]
MNEKYIGSSFEDFLEEENIEVEVRNEAIKRLISYNLLNEMKAQNINKTEMAKKMNTSRAALDRLLNPKNDSVTLATLTRAANVLGKKLVLQLQ